MALSELFLDAQTATTGSFTLEEGVYWIDAVDTHGNGGPEWYIQKLGSDGATWIGLAPRQVSTGVSAILNNVAQPGTNFITDHLPKGDYRFLLYAGTAHGTYFNIIRLKSAA